MKVHLTTLKDLTGLHCSLPVRLPAAYIGMLLPAKQSYIWPSHINMVSQETLAPDMYRSFLCTYLGNVVPFFLPQRSFPEVDLLFLDLI